MIPALLLLAAAPVVHADHTTMGVHGMALFGGPGGLYASHLPLFRAPHDRQILLELEAVDPTLRREVTQALAAAPRLWTIEPERFALAGLLPGAARPVKTFRARVFDGHFERGGRLAFDAVPFRVKRVLVNRQLTAATPPAKVTYDRFGAFLVKRLEGRPDIDHIVALAAARGPTRITVARADTPGALEKALAPYASVRTTIYFETDDLR